MTVDNVGNGLPIHANFILGRFFITSSASIHATMNLFSFLRQHADQIGGQFTDYDHTKGVIVIPVTKSRFQTILVTLKPSQYSGKDLVMFTSKVCEYTSAVNTKELLEENNTFDYARFMIEDGYVKIEASCVAATAAEDHIKEMLDEVANVADRFELDITGQDVY